MSPETRDFSEADCTLLEVIGELAERELHLSDTIELQRAVVEAQALADELLDIVVPLGVSLWADRDFEHLVSADSSALPVSLLDSVLSAGSTNSAAMRRMALRASYSACT